MAVPKSTKERDDVMVLDNAKVIVKTAGAVLCEHELLDEIPNEKDRWIPWSQVDDDSEIMEASNKGDEGDLVITNWIAEKKGLI